MRSVFRRLFPRMSGKDAVTVVSGLPRSGTSMMMRMLEAGGMEVVTDDLREPDENNPQGYYEYGPVKKIKENTSWLERCRGRAVKIVSILLYHLPPDREYKVIFMRRDIEEVLASQRLMLQRLGKQENDVEETEMADKFKKHLNRVCAWLEAQQNIRVLYVSYNATITNPGKYAGKVNDFLGGRLDEDKMVQVVQKRLYRQRKRGVFGGE